jgi:type I restriction-modification system DNA methylase subunit/restriction endonuclease S subunit
MSEKKESGSESGKIYTCKLCKKIFKQKCDYDKHANKKAPCISLAACEALIVKKDEAVDSKKELTTFFKNCLDLLRDNEGLTGEKALRNLSYLLILKLLEPHFGGIIDIDNYQFDFKISEDDSEDVIIHNKARLLSCIRFSNLSKENEVNIPKMMKYLWDIILSVHPSTKNIFIPEKRFDIQKQTTYKKIVDKLNRIDLSCVENDILGDSYEEVIQYIMTGKVLGQFFTPPLIKKFMIKLIDPQIFSNGQIESCCDPTMGTGGFLIEYIRVIQEKAKLNDISLDWQFIKNGGLYGKELEPDTYQLAVSNMLISTGHMFEQLDRGDSIREPITQKFNIILSNPPFGIKGLKYDDFNNALKDQYVPIKTDNAVSLFIQAIIYMLKIGGKCTIVLPDGQDLFSKTNTTLVAVREYLMKTCDLKEIYLLPSGIFEHTDIKTCIFYFVKRREGNEVIRIKTQTQKNTKKEYEFSKTHQTLKVSFYDYNPYQGNGIKNLLVEVPIEKIVSNSYSLNYAEYLRDDVEEEQYENGIVVKKLGEICTFLPKSKRQASYGEKQGKYPFFTSSQTCNKYCDKYDYEDECLIIGTGGNANIKYSSNFSCSTDNFVIKINTGQLLKYIYYYLSINIELLQKGFIGSGLQHISKEYFNNIKIPIPSLERQQEIVKYLDFIYEKANKTSYDKIAELKQLNEFCLKNQRIFGENVVEKLGNIFKEVKTGKDVIATDRKKGEYPFYGANGIIDYVDNFIFDGKYLLTARTGSLGSLHISNGKFWCSGDVHRIEFEDDTLLSYTYYYLQTIDFQKFRTGAAHPKLSGSSLKSIKINVPSFERQKEIVAYCESNDALIKQLEIEIENNKKEAQQFLKNTIRFQAQEDEDENEHSSEE